MISMGMLQAHICRECHMTDRCIECMNWMIGKDPWITVVLDDGYVPVPM